MVQGNNGYVWIGPPLPEQVPTGDPEPVDEEAVAQVYTLQKLLPLVCA